MTLYKLIDHTADLGIEIKGRTKRELFTKAVLSLMDVLIERTEPVKGKANLRQRTLTVEGSDIDDLLVNFLREVLYLFNGEALIVAKCEISKCCNKTLDARLWLESYNKEKYLVKTEIKAVTYHGLAVENTKSGWSARVIVDV